MIKRTSLFLALVATAAVTQANPTSTDARDAIAALNHSLAFAEKTIQEVQSQEAINMLTASIAEADLTIAIAEANFAIREVSTQEAFNQLAAAVAQADLTIASVEAQVAINSVSDDQLLNELEGTLANADSKVATDMILAVVSERPMLASAVQDRALSIGLDEQLVASALTAGFSEAAATAAGK